MLVVRNAPSTMSCSSIPSTFSLHMVGA